MLAAAPTTPVQLAHACLAAGYHAAIPASWGDELIAARAIERMRDADTPLVQCSCPYVSRRLAAHGDTIAPMLLMFVSPAVATAQYLRAVYAPSRPRLTYAGGCPAAAHDSIDVWLSPDELMSALAERGISPSEQPKEFDSVLPPDRRRYFSEPGGIPSRHALRNLPTPVDIVELTGTDIVVDIAQQLLSTSRSLIDVALPLGCCCSGATGAVTLEASRARVRDHEPPRALAPVVDHSIRLLLEATLPGSAPAVSEEVPPAALASLPRTPRSSESVEPAPAAVEVIPRRRSPTGLSRPVLGTMPIARSEAGRQLPRAYVARRRSSPRGIRESSLKGPVPAPPQKTDERRRWLLVAAAGVAVGLLIAGLIATVF